MEKGNKQVMDTSDLKLLHRLWKNLSFVTFTALVFKPWDSTLSRRLSSSRSLGISTFVYFISISFSQMKEEVETKKLSALSL